jgi:hypothetical protein
MHLIADLRDDIIALRRLQLDDRRYIDATEAINDLSALTIRPPPPPIPPSPLPSNTGREFIAVHRCSTLTCYSDATAPVYRKSTTSNSPHNVADRDEYIVGLGPATFVFEPAPVSNFAFNFVLKQWYYFKR